MRLWTYTRPFQYREQNCVVKVFLTPTKCISRLFIEGRCVDEQSYGYLSALETIVHPLPNHQRANEAVVEMGFVSWWTVGIVVTAQGNKLYESHPGGDVRFGEKLFNSSGALVATHQASHDNLQGKKYSIYADLALGALFFVVGKVTEDLALAAIVGAGAGIALVVMQRFVKVDLLGGFAVFGTIMLLISAAFSLILQDDYWVQMKSSVLGLLTASVFMIDGLFRKGAYFGARIERYMPIALHHGRIAVGMSVVGIAMAGANYLVANHFSEDFWLTYTTFLDLPLSMVFFLAVIFWAQRIPIRNQIKMRSE